LVFSDLAYRLTRTRLRPWGTWLVYRGLFALQAGVFLFPRRLFEIVRCEDEMPQRWVKRTIRPPEVAGIASHFRSAANQVYDLAARLERVARQLEPTWEGNSKDRFFADFTPTPSQVRNCGDTLNRLASEIENITVEIDVRENY